MSTAVLLPNAFSTDNEHQENTSIMNTQIQWIRIVELAELLGVSLQMAYKLIREGDIPAVRIGRTYRIDPKDVDIYLKNSRIAVQERAKKYKKVLSTED